MANAHHFSPASCLFELGIGEKKETWTKLRTSFFFSLPWFFKIYFSLKNVDIIPE